MKKSKNRWNPVGLSPEGQRALIDLRRFHSGQIIELGGLYENRMAQLAAEYAQARQALHDQAEATAAEIREKHSVREL